MAKEEGCGERELESGGIGACLSVCTHTLKHAQTHTQPPADSIDDMMHDGTVHARWRYTQFKGAGGREEARAWGRRARCQPARGSRLEFRVEE